MRNKCIQLYVTSSNKHQLVYILLPQSWFCYLLFYLVARVRYRSKKLISSPACIYPVTSFIYSVTPCDPVTSSMYSVTPCIYPVTSSIYSVTPCIYPVTSSIFCDTLYISCEAVTSSIYSVTPCIYPVTSSIFCDTLYISCDIFYILWHPVYILWHLLYSVTPCIYPVTSSMYSVHPVYILWHRVITLVFLSTMFCSITVIQFYSIDFPCFLSLVSS